VTKNTVTPIAVGENRYRVTELRRLIENQAVDIVAPDLPKVGGMRETRKIADVANQYYVPVAMHNVASPIATMAATHVGAAIPNSLAIEYSFLRARLVGGPRRGGRHRGRLHRGAGEARYRPHTRHGHRRGAYGRRRDAVRSGVSRSELDRRAQRVYRCLTRRKPKSSAEIEDFRSSTKRSVASSGATPRASTLAGPPSRFRTQKRRISSAGRTRRFLS